jgi:hypothetical protein
MAVRRNDAMLLSEALTLRISTNPAGIGRFLPPDHRHIGSGNHFDCQRISVLRSIRSTTAVILLFPVGLRIWQGGHVQKLLCGLPAGIAL